MKIVSNRLKVGYSPRPDKFRKNRKESKIREYLLYCDCPKDNKGFVDPSLYLPADYDLCDLMLFSGKEIKGWWTGTSWYGLRLKNKDIIKKWRRIEGT